MNQYLSPSGKQYIAKDVGYGVINPDIQIPQHELQKGIFLGLTLSTERLKAMDGIANIQLHGCKQTKAL